MKNFTIRAEKYFGMWIFSLFVLTLSVFTSCKQPTWNDPVREYLEYYTETAAVEDFEVVQSYLIDKDGNICISSFGEETKEILLYMRNPKKFPITASGITGTGITIVQDSDDPSVLHLTYPQDYLLPNECGGDIGGVISLTESVTPREMPDSYDLKLKCNSAPDKIDDAALMRFSDGSSDTFVLAFNRPASYSCSSSLNGWNRDIVSVTINGETYPVSIDGSGVMTFSDSKFTTTELTLLPINRLFTHSSRAVYFLTGEPFAEGNKTYTIGFNDEAGLSSTITVDTAVARLSAPTTVKNNDNGTLSESSVNNLHTDSDGAESSTVRIFVPAVDEIGNSVSDVTLHYELFKGGYSDVVSDTVTRIVPNATNPGTVTGAGPVEVELPDEAPYYLVAWVSNPDHRDSAKVRYKLNLQYAQLKAPDVKDFGDNLLSATATNNLLELDSGHNYATVKISRPTQTTAGSSVSGTTLVYTLCSGAEISDDAAAINSPTDVNLTTVTLGQWCLKVKATKTGYRDSDEKTYLIEGFSSHVWVKSGSGGGDDTNGDGTQAHPFATVQRAVSEIVTYNKSSVEYTVHVDGTVTGSQTISNALNGKASKLTLKGENSGTLDGNNSDRVLTVSTNVPLEISSLVITKGYANEGAGLYAGSGSSITLKTGTKICSNNATRNYNTRGGGVYVNTGASVTLDGGIIGGSSTEKNTCTELGGGVYVVGTFTLKSGTISYNTASNSSNRDNNGGGIYVASGATCNINGGYIRYNTVRDDTTKSSKGAGIYSAGQLIMDGGEINNNTSGVTTEGYGTGGGVEFSGTFELKGGKIYANEAYSGAGVYCDGGTLLMSGSAKIGDSTLGSGTYSNVAQYGGGLYCNGSSNIYIGYTATNSKDNSFSGGFYSNRAYNDGGAIYAGSSITNFNISKGTINNNRAGMNGGGIYHGCTLKVFDINMSGNECASGNGGAIYVNETLEMSGNVSIPVGSSAKKNDVYLFGIAGSYQWRILPLDSLPAGTDVTITPAVYEEERQVIMLNQYGSDSWYLHKIKVLPEDDDYNWYISNTKLYKGYTLTEALSAIANAAGSRTIKIAGALTSADITAIKNAINAAYENDNRVKINLDLSGVPLTSLPSNAFLSCNGLSEITLPEGLTSLGSQAFRDCTNLTEVHLPSTIPLSGTQGYLTFYGTTTKVTVSENSPYLSNGTGALYSKDRKKLVMYNNKSSTSGFTVPASVQEICNDAFGHSQMNSISFASSTNLKKLGDYVFADAPNITTVNLPNSIETIGTNCFRYNSALTSINIPASLTIIPESFCCYSSHISRIVIPNGVTTIGHNAFWAIGSYFTEIVIPTTVTKIEKTAFSQCSALTDVYYRGPESQKNSIDISSDEESGHTNSCLLNATWHYNYTGS